MATGKDPALAEPFDAFGLQAERDRQVMESGQPLLNYEQQRTSSTGRTCWLRQSKLPLRDARGRIIGVLTTYEDITASKQAAQALYESEARYRTAGEAIRYGHIHMAIEDFFAFYIPDEMDVGMGQ